MHILLQGPILGEDQRTFNENVIDLWKYEAGDLQALSLEKKTLAKTSGDVLEMKVGQMIVPKRRVHVGS